MKRIKVALIDSGIDINHKYLKNNILYGKSYAYKDNKIVVSNEIEDINGHGTSCASIIKSEYEYVDFIIIKIFDRNGLTNIKVLEESLNYLISIDVKIINLSLAIHGDINSCKDLYRICEKLKNQNKIIVSSLANYIEESYPSIFDNVIGVKGSLLKKRSSFWYNSEYKYQCVVDDSDRIVADLGNSFKLVEKSNSFSAAKMSGKIANIIANKVDISFDGLSRILEELSECTNWKDEDLYTNKRIIDYKQYLYENNNINLNRVLKVLVDNLNIRCNVDILFNSILFSKYIGLKNDNCIKILKKLENEFNIKIDYTKVYKEDLISIYTLTNFIEKESICEHFRNCKYLQKL
ncbi:TPA: S8 family serine peptidase [Clostridioides difficile]|nr:S8 family serine peptidase [Clostridioides difficile]